VIHTGGVFYGIPKGQKANKLDMIVIRIDSSGDMVNSRPCHNCLDMMKAVGVRKIFYSHNNNIICERVNNMISINSSSIMRKLERDYY